MERRHLTVRDVTSPFGAKGLYEFSRGTGLIPPNGPVRTVFDLTARGETPQESTAVAANRELLRSINDVYKLSDRSLSPEAFFTQKLEHANTQVTELLDKFCPQEAKVHGLYYTEPLPKSPVELLSQLNSPDMVNDRTKYALRRLVGIALVTAQMEAASQGAKDVIDNMQALLISRLAFSGLEDKIVYSLHDNRTNSVVWTTGSGKERTKDASKKLSNPHLKKHECQTWQLDDVGLVSIKRRIKPNPALKALREAIGRSKDGGDDSLQPLTDVKDAVGLEFVIHNAFSSKDETVTSLRGQVKEILKEGFELTDANFEVKKRNNASYQSVKFETQRDMVTLPELNVKIELMYHGMGDYLNNIYEIVDIDPKNHNTIGRAHELMEVKRDVAVLEELFPDKIYGGIPWDAIRERSYDRIIEKLQTEKRVTADKQQILELMRSEIF